MYAQYIKRMLDVILLLAELIVFSPFLLSFMFIGTIAMGRTPFFIQRRAGKIRRETGQERIFSLIKFRTMSNAKMGTKSSQAVPMACS